MDIIYEPKGPAKEYAPLAITCYMGCGHCCKYCYVPEQIKKSSDEYFSGPGPREDIINKVKKDAGKLSLARSDLFHEQPDNEILISFIGDPYQPAEMELHITCHVIEILIQHNLPFTILTKGGTRAVRDFNLLSNYPKARFGTTLIFTDQKDVDYWEPYAAPVNDRIKALKKAHDKGIPTWISIEPVIKSDQALKLVRDLHPIVDHWKIGKINYNKEVENRVNWTEFREEIKELLESLGADYYLKKSLTEL